MRTPRGTIVASFICHRVSVNGQDSAISLLSKSRSVCLDKRLLVAQEKLGGSLLFMPPWPIIKHHNCSSPFGDTYVNHEHDILHSKLRRLYYTQGWFTRSNSRWEIILEYYTAALLMIEWWPSALHNQLDSLRVLDSMGKTRDNGPAVSRHHQTPSDVTM